MNLSWECCPDKLFWSMSDRGAMVPEDAPERPFLLKTIRRLSFKVSRTWSVFSFSFCLLALDEAFTSSWVLIKNEHKV